MGIKVIVSPILKREVKKKFKGESTDIFRRLNKLGENHYEGKLLTQVGGTLIKEVRLRGFRFYYVVDNYRLRLFDRGELEGLLIRFVRMSNKKSQQKVIEEIRVFLRKLGEGGI